MPDKRQTAGDDAMSGHTAGPWELSKHSAHGDYDICAPSYEGGDPVGWFLYIGHGLKGYDEEELFDEFEANARRIVACVNACAGIETETLEKGLAEFGDGWLAPYANTTVEDNP